MLCWVSICAGMANREASAVTPLPSSSRWSARVKLTMNRFVAG
jgi:hypothetical protein